MTDQEKLNMLEEAFEMEAGTLKATEALENLDSWDSLEALSLFVLLSDNFDKKITGAMITKFVTVQDVLNVMA